MVMIWGQRRILSGLLGFGMIWAVAGSTALARPSVLEEGAITLPSGHTAMPFDMVWDEDQSVIRPRYVVEELSFPGSAYANNPFDVFDDMLWLCNTQIMGLYLADEALQQQGWRGVIITMMSTPLDFGIRDPDVVQFFESFVFTDDGCMLDDDEYHD